MTFTFQLIIQPVAKHSRTHTRTIPNPRDPDEVGTTTENVVCEGEYCNLQHLLGHFLQDGN